MLLLRQLRHRVGQAVGFGARENAGRVERRHATRLKDGAVRPCPGCEGVLQFRQDYRIWRTGRNTLEPAWVCHRSTCGYREFVRA